MEGINLTDVAANSRVICGANGSSGLGGEIAVELVDEEPDVDEGGVEPVEQPPVVVTGAERVLGDVGFEESCAAGIKHFEVGQFSFNVSIVNARVDDSG